MTSYSVEFKVNKFMLKHGFKWILGRDVEESITIHPFAGWWSNKDDLIVTQEQALGLYKTFKSRWRLWS